MLKVNDLMFIYNNYIKLLKLVFKIKLILFFVDSEIVILFFNYIYIFIL